MSENDENMLLKATVARLERDVARMFVPDRGIARARRGQSLALWVGAAGLCSLPVLGWAAVSLTEFQPNTPIVAAEVNENFSQMNAALDGPVVFAAQPVELSSVDGAAAEALLDNAVVDITTQGGRVHVELVPSSGAGESFVVLRCVANQECRSHFHLERSSDGGGTWERRATVDMLGVALNQAPSGLVLPPGVIEFIDEPPAGEWRYQLVAENTSQTISTAVSNAWLTARELGSPP